MLSFRERCRDEIKHRGVGTHGSLQPFEALELPMRERHLIRDECIEILEGVFELEAAVVVVSFDPAVVDSVPTAGHIEEILPCCGSDQRAVQSVCG